MVYTDEFWNKVLSECGYKYIGKDIAVKGKKRKIISICPNGNEYKFISDNFLNKGKRCSCPSCSKKFLWTDNRIDTVCRFYDLIYLGKDQNNDRRIITKCKNGNVKSQELGGFVKNPKCICEECEGTISWTDERLKQEIEPYGYKFISKVYRKDGKLTRYFNSLCPSGNPYKIEIHKFLKGRRCNCEDCTGRIWWTDERLKEELSNHGLEYISHAITKLYDKDVTFKCKNGGISTATIHNLIARNWECSCEICTGRIKYTQERILSELERANYTYINHYYDDTGHLRVECECEHGHYYNCNFWNFVHQNVRCDQCKLKSKGETQINDDFNSLGIKFVHEQTFEDCTYIRLLKFDFAVYGSLDNISFICEYDGEQHFHPSRFGNQTIEDAQKCFDELQIRDNIKNEYCKNNNIPLIRVPYTVPLKDTFEYISNKLKDKYDIDISDYYYISKSS